MISWNAENELKNFRSDGGLVLQEVKKMKAKINARMTFFFWIWCLLGQLEDTGTVEGIGTALVSRLCVERCLVISVHVGQEVELQQRRCEK